MDKKTRNFIRKELDRKARERSEDWMNCDPSRLTERAVEAEELGELEVAQALINFRDKVVNVLLGEGWTLERIEAAMLHQFESGWGRK